MEQDRADYQQRNGNCHIHRYRSKRARGPDEPDLALPDARTKPTNCDHSLKVCDKEVASALRLGTEPIKRREPTVTTIGIITEDRPNSTVTLNG